MGGGIQPTFRAAGVGVAAEVSPGWEVSTGPCRGRSLGVLGPCLHKTRVQGGRHLGAELSGVDFGEDRPGERGTGSWSGTRFLKPRLSVSPPLGFCFRLLPVLWDSVWFILGRARARLTRRGGEEVLTPKALFPPSLPLSLCHSDIQDFNLPGPLSPVVSCPTTSVGSLPHLGFLRQRAAEG